MDIPRLGDLTSQVLTSLLTSFLALIPTLVGGALLLAVGVIIGAIFKRALLTIFKVFKVDELAKSYKVANVEGRDLPWSHIFSEIVRWSIIIGFLRIASAVWGLSAVRGIDAIISYVPIVLSATIILIVATMIATLVYHSIYTATKAFSGEAARIASNISKWAIILFAAIYTLGLLTGIRSLSGSAQNAVAIALAIAFGFAFGLGGQDAARDLLKALKSKL